MIDDVNESSLVLALNLVIGPHGRADDQIVESVAVQIAGSDGVTEISADLIAGHVIDVDQLGVVEQHLSDEPGTPGHADGHVGAIAVARKVAGGHRVAEVRIVIVGAAFAGLVLIAELGQVLTEYLTYTEGEKSLQLALKR